MRQRQTFERDVYVYVEGLNAKGPQVAPYGIREFEVVDLNGYRLTFGESIP